MSVTAVPLQPTRRRNLVLLWAGIIIAVVAAVLLAAFGSPIHTTASGLRYEVIQPGTGTDHPTDQDVALINYVGKLSNGKTFDASKQPTPMPVSGSIPGFSEGLKLMTKGAKYRFWIPANLAYGDKSPDPSVIPNGAALTFDVQLIDFINQDVLQRQMQMQQMMQGGGMPGGAPGGEGQAPGGAPAGQ
jgi:FKBP-type peptidyl-prolyl cis-trans isomerase FkpA